MPNPNPNPIDAAVFLAEFDGGESYSVIARRHHVSAKRARRFFVEHGRLPPETRVYKKRPLAPTGEDGVAKAALAGKSLSEIRREYDVSEARVRRIVRDHLSEEQQAAVKAKWKAAGPNIAPLNRLPDEPTEWAWVASLIESRGNWTRRLYGYELSVSAPPSLVTAIKSIFGGSGDIRMGRINWSWVVRQRNQITDIITGIRPHLRVMGSATDRVMASYVESERRKMGARRLELEQNGEPDGETEA